MTPFAFLSRMTSGSVDKNESTFYNLRQASTMTFRLSTLITAFCLLLLTGCSNSPENQSNSKSLETAAAIKVDGKRETKSNLLIASENTSESAVSVINGGQLTLNDSKIIKTALAGSTAGIPSDSLQETGKESDTGTDSATGSLPANPITDKNPEEYQARSESGMGGAPPDPNQAPGKDRAPDPNLAPTTPGPPGTPGGAPPDDGATGDARMTPPHLLDEPDPDAEFDPDSGFVPGPELASDIDEAVMLGGAGDIGSMGSGIYIAKKGEATLSNVTIDTDLGEGKGVCVIDNGSAITVNKGSIITAGASSHGVFVSLGGEAFIKGVSIVTKGEHSSALATDTGGGTITVEGGTYATSGKYSAGIYSTGTIRAANASFRAEADNVAVIEGANRIVLDNTALWSGEKGAVMLYQSHGADSSPSEYSMTGGQITAEDGPIFYVTNTSTKINLRAVTLSGASGVVLEALKGDWGSDVAFDKPINGGIVHLIADEQILPGNIVLDENSTVSLELKNGSVLKGSVNSDNKGGKIDLALDSSSTWDVTADSYIDTLTVDELAGNSISNIIGNGHNIYYEKSANAETLGGKKYDLAGGGKLMPKDTSLLSQRLELNN
jgi:hypothetical protein